MRKEHLKDILFRTLAAGKEKRHFSRPPVLVGGAPRSGTTWLLAMLEAHPHIWAVPKETNAFRSWEQGMPLKRYRVYKELLKAKVKPSAHRWCEKTPCHVRFIPEIRAYFKNEFRFIHIIRDGRDVITSKLPGHEARYFVSPQQWIQDVSAGLAHANEAEVLSIKYEELVEDHEASLHRICDFLDEPALPEFLNWFQHATKRNDKAWETGLKAKYSHAVGRWKKPEHQARIEEAMANPEFADLLAKLGY
jgi:hypothetical protein